MKNKKSESKIKNSINKVKQKQVLTIMCMLIIALVAVSIGFFIKFICSKNYTSEVSMNPVNNNEGNSVTVYVGEEDLNKPVEEVELEDKDEPEEKRTKYYIKINLQTQTVVVYGQDSLGEYTVPVKGMLCSTGKATPTTGVYKTSDKYRWAYLAGGVYGQYATRIVGDILFHSVPYEKNNAGTLEYWEYDKLGQPASLGCVRLTVDNAKWIFNNCETGTQVEFYSSSNPGPYGIPSAKKITKYGEPLNRWDPTDPDSKNPWKNKDIVDKAESNLNNSVVDLDKGNSVTNTNNENITNNTNSVNNVVNNSVNNIVNKTENQSNNKLNNVNNNVNNSANQNNNKNDSTDNVSNENSIVNNNSSNNLNNDTNNNSNSNLNNNSSNNDLSNNTNADASNVNNEQSNSVNNTINNTVNNNEDNVNSGDNTTNNSDTTINNSTNNTKNDLNNNVNKNEVNNTLQNIEDDKVSTESVQNSNTDVEDNKND